MGLLSGWLWVRAPRSEVVILDQMRLDMLSAKLGVTREAGRLGG